MSSADTADVVVAGSGVVGLGATYAAVRRGRRVIIVDPTTAPVGATIRDFGHRCIGAQSGEARRYADLSRELWLRLSRDAGFWLRASGTFVVARHADEIAVLEVAWSAAASGCSTPLSSSDSPRSGCTASSAARGSRPP